ncbi:hypothetical protein PsorP6_014673 [Peronosclerospora sorghi]|uniref:Uncharacterized protein n=1 Tax=Peronosclerospora sorghi TaxID=230839 RepID=A0ACC0VU31_9STRA|nr:hypothetical protein PsorP6_014673 [Peronosclerospora sorghi]
MNSHLWVIGVTLSLTATLFGTLGKVLLKLSHTSSQTLSVKAAVTVCVVMLNHEKRLRSSAILAPMAGFSVVWNIVLSPYLLNEKLSTHDTPTHRSAELFRLFESRIFVEYAVFAVFLAVAVRLQIELDWYVLREKAVGEDLDLAPYYSSLASVALVAEGGSIWYRPETYVIFVAALSSSGGGIYVLNLGLREHDELYLVAIYQAFLILIGSVSGVIFFDEISGMNTRWQLVVYPFSIVTTVEGIIVLSENHTEHCDPGILSARIIGAEQGEISPLISQNDRVKHGVIRGFVDIV